MIKIDVFNNPESARAVFKAYYDMICEIVSSSISHFFSYNDIADAISIQFKKEYKEELGLNNEKARVKRADCRNILSSNASYKKIYDFLYSNGKLQKEKLGILLCGYMDDANLKKLRKDCSFSSKESKESKVLKDKIFQYELMSKQQTFVYKFVESMNIQVCPYCNRNYISVVKDKNDGFKTRPELDHFYNKSKYPYLAVSMRNLVPSCHVCNLAKHNEDKNILYPYKEGLGNTYRFAIDTSQNISYFTDSLNTEFGIELKKNKFAGEDTDNEFDEKVKHSSKLFGWNSLYNLT